MGDQLLVRAYNVGCGDCFYIRIPNSSDGFHILIDCGSKESASTGVLKRAISHLEQAELPEGSRPGKKRLDAIVVTHRHEDHIKGFDKKYFKNIEIKNIWITAAMDVNHRQAQRSFTLNKLATQAVKELENSKASLSPEFAELIELYGISNKGATEALTNELPSINGIKPKYIFAGMSSTDLGVEIDDTEITILAPEQDIDRYYLGKEADHNLQAFQEGAKSFRRKSKTVPKNGPQNIGQDDFNVLRSRMLSNGLAFAVDDSKIQNNVSAVLLIEWKGKRLLFVGDAEWEDSFQDGKKNGSWNVMWHKRGEHLNHAIDFLKCGHHGSHNSTPWNRSKNHADPINELFDTILPLPQPGETPRAKCLVSTKRKQYDTIPDAELLVEIGKRVSNTKNYMKEFKEHDPNFDPENEIFNYSVMKEYSKRPSPRQVGDKGWLDKPQPWRTDLESSGKGRKEMVDQVEFIEVKL